VRTVRLSIPVIYFGYRAQFHSDLAADTSTKNLSQASKEYHYYPLPSTIADANTAVPPPHNSAVIVATANNHNCIKKEEEVKKEVKYEKDNMIIMIGYKEIGVSFFTLWRGLAHCDFFRTCRGGAR
jgi:hypothetical protein